VHERERTPQVLEDLGNSRYLMKAYARSSDSWENFRQTGQQASLYEVAAILCGAWTTLSDDEDFFTALSEMAHDRMDSDLRIVLSGDTVRAKDPDRNRVLTEFAAHLDADKLLARELVVLVQAGMDPVHALRLVDDLGEHLSGRLRAMPGPEMATLQQNVPTLAAELCKARQALKVFDYDPLAESEEGAPPHRRWVTSLRLVGKALGATAGAAGAVGNVVAAVASFGILTGFGLASVLAGAQAMSTSIADALEAGTPPDAPRPRRRTPRQPPRGG
jgi:hypothetical protein